MNLKEFKKVKADFMKQSRQALASEFKDFFAKYPEVNAVRWAQYTPHFNDGMSVNLAVTSLMFVFNPIRRVLNSVTKSLFLVLRLTTMIFIKAMS